MNDDGKIADEIYPLWWKTAFVTEACMAISERGDRSQNPDRLVWTGLFAIMGDIERGLQEINYLAGNSEDTDSRNP